MEQGCRYGGRTHAYLFRDDASHCQRVADIWVTVAPAVIAMCLLGKLKDLGD